MKLKNLLLVTATAICALSSSLTYAAYSEASGFCYSPPQSEVSLITPSEADCGTGYLWVKPNAKFYVKAETQVRLKDGSWAAAPGRFTLYRRNIGGGGIEIFRRDFSGVYNFGTWTNGSKTEIFLANLYTRGGYTHMGKLKSISGTIYTND